MTNLWRSRREEERLDGRLTEGELYKTKLKERRLLELFGKKIWDQATPLEFRKKENMGRNLRISKRTSVVEKIEQRKIPNLKLCFPGRGTLTPREV